MNRVARTNWSVRHIAVAVFITTNLLSLTVRAQPKKDTPKRWIRPVNPQSPAVWGIRGGIVIGLWPWDVETGWPDSRIRPRGLIRIGYELNGLIYLINFIAVEPVVNGKMEFSEVSPSRADNRLGKLMWAGDDPDEPGKFFPNAITRGVITQPDKPGVEQLTLYVFMEKFKNGAHPYLKVTIRSDRPQEVGFQIFNQEDSTPMDRCALTATMGNYERLRLLYLKNDTVDARKLYRGYDGIDFVEKESYPAKKLKRNANDDIIAVAAPNESFAELSSWPQKTPYLRRWWWRYRPFFKVIQYWKKEGDSFDPSLRVRVNGRAKYWSGGSKNPDDYIRIPGGVAFENFEMREKYHPGQKFYFGISRETPDELIENK